MGAKTTQRVTVIGRPGCVQCTATYRALDARRIECRSSSTSSGTARADELRALGFTQLPVVQVEGMRPGPGFLGSAYVGCLLSCFLESKTEGKKAS
ncbi:MULTISPECIES: glutaredoxin domain-containing protein [Microbacterium]|uniref:glutaredoxin domain-containing protein n=1 Tax=Microbacterium TaxID=33882 RepID=UPI000D6541D5